MMSNSDVAGGQADILRLVDAIQCGDQSPEYYVAAIQAVIDDAAKADWSKHGATEIALGQWKSRALAAEAALAAEREALLKAGECARNAREFDQHRVDIRIEIDRGFFVITRAGGVIESHHTVDGGALPALVTSRIAALRTAELTGLKCERDLLEAAAPLSARETARYLAIENRLLDLEDAAIRAQGE